MCSSGAGSCGRSVSLVAPGSRRGDGEGFSGRETNRESLVWVEGKNDHARDLYNMQFFGATVEGLIPDPASERLSQGEEDNDEPIA